MSKYINRPRFHKTTSKSLKNLRYTRRLARKKIFVYMVFHNESDDIEFYKNETIAPLYVALSTEEATAACCRLAYVQHLDHYLRWCVAQNLKPGIDEGSWQLYSTDVLGGINSILNAEFKIIGAVHSLGDFFSIYRTFNNCSTVLGLPTETSGELLEFVSKAELATPDPASTDAPPSLADVSNSPDSTLFQLASVLHCTDIGDFLGRLSLIDLNELIDKQTLSPILSIWRQMVQQIYFDENGNNENPSPNIPAIVFDKSIETVSRLTADLIAAIKQQQEQPPFVSQNPFEE